MVLSCSPEAVALYEALQTPPTGPDAIGRIQSLLTQALREHHETQEKAGLLTSSNDANERARALSERLELVMKRRRDLLERLAQAQILVPLAGDGEQMSWGHRSLSEEFLSLTLEISSLADELWKEQFHNIPQSAAPPAEETVALAQAVIAGRCRPFTLRNQIPHLRQYIQETTRSHSLFLEAHPERELDDYLLTALEGFIGAVDRLEVFVLSPQPDLGELADLLGPLASNAIQLEMAEKEMLTHRRSRGIAVNPVLNSFGLKVRQVARGSRPPQELEEHFSRLLAHAASLRQECQALEEERLPVSSLREEWDNVVEPALRHFEALVKEQAAVPAAQWPEQADRMWTILRAGMDARRLKREWCEKDWRSRSMPQAPDWELLREAAYSWYFGKLPGAIFQECLDQCFYLLTLARAQLPEGSRGQASALTGVLGELTELFEGFRKCIAGTDRTAIPQLVEDLEDDYDRWLWCLNSLAKVPQGKQFSDFSGPLHDRLQEASHSVKTIVEMQPFLLSCRESILDARKRVRDFRLLNSARIQGEQDLGHFEAQIDDNFRLALDDLTQLLRVTDPTKLVYGSLANIERIRQRLLEIEKLRSRLREKAAQLAREETPRASSSTLESAEA